MIVAKYGFPVPLTLKMDPKTIEEVTVDAKGKIMQLESEQYKAEKEMLKKKAKLERRLPRRLRLNVMRQI